MCADYGDKHQTAPVIVEYIYKPYSPNPADREIAEIENAVLELMKILYYSGSTQIRIPKYCSYFHIAKTYRFGLIYEIPLNLGWYTDKNN